jgi:hypothetical protein
MCFVCRLLAWKAKQDSYFDCGIAQVMMPSEELLAQIVCAHARASASNCTMVGWLEARQLESVRKVPGIVPLALALSGQSLRNHSELISAFWKNWIF